VNEGRRGRVGEIFAIDADLSHSYGGKRYIPYSATYPAGTAYLLTCHVIEYVLPMMNERMPEECHSIVMPAPGDPEGTPSHTLTIARWPHTTLTVTVCSKGTQGRRHLRVDGSDGVMELEPIKGLKVSLFNFPF
jgi:predicted dehydrogenase